MVWSPFGPWAKNMWDPGPLAAEAEEEGWVAFWGTEDQSFWGEMGSGGVVDEVLEEEGWMGRT